MTEPTDTKTDTKSIFNYSDRNNGLLRRKALYHDNKGAPSYDSLHLNSNQGPRDLSESHGRSPRCNLYTYYLRRITISSMGRSKRLGAISNARAIRNSMVKQGSLIPRSMSLI